MKEIYFLVIFLVVFHIIVPTFQEFTYFFLLDVIHISKFTFALLVLMAQLAILLGALFYRAFFRNIDTRVMIIWALITGAFGAFMNYTFAKRWNLEIDIDDMVFLLFTDVVFHTLSTLLMHLPLLAVFAKITPPKIEGTTFAFLTGTANFGGTVISPAMGTWINYQFVGVSKDDLSNYSTLILIEFIGRCLAFALIPLIPTKKQIIENREVRKKEYLKKKK